MSEQATAAVGTDAAKTGHVKLSWREKNLLRLRRFWERLHVRLGPGLFDEILDRRLHYPAGAVAGIFAFTKIFDAFMDPIAGSAIDSRKNIGPRGKFRPVMMISSIILAILTVITFTMPEISTAGKILFAYGAYMAWGLVYSFTNIPYASLASVMTRDVEERSQMATTRQAGSIGAQLITGIAFVPIVLLFDQPHHGFFVASIVMAVVGVLGFAICYFNCHEHVPVKRNTAKEQKAKFSGLHQNRIYQQAVIVHYLDDLIHDFRHEYEQPDDDLLLPV